MASTRTMEERKIRGHVGNVKGVGMKSFRQCVTKSFHACLTALLYVSHARASSVTLPSTEPPIPSSKLSDDVDTSVRVRLLALRARPNSTPAEFYMPARRPDVPPFKIGIARREFSQRSDVLPTHAISTPFQSSVSPAFRRLWRESTTHPCIDELSPPSSKGCLLYRRPRL